MRAFACINFDGECTIVEKLRECLGIAAGKPLHNHEIVKNITVARYLYLSTKQF